MLLLDSHYQNLRLGQWFPRSEQWFIVSYWMILAVMMTSTFSQALMWNNKDFVVLSHQLGGTVTDSENGTKWWTKPEHVRQRSWSVVCLSCSAVEESATAHMTMS